MTDIPERRRTWILRADHMCLCFVPDVRKSAASLERKTWQELRGNVHRAEQLAELGTPPPKNAR
ncbi:MAG: hypothetical protein R3316_10850 [Rhodovibrionaceae bacterium]|nr:hypothetical protein [Rhodovibrionaceae bacterium]